MVHENVIAVRLTSGSGHLGAGHHSIPGQPLMRPGLPPHPLTSLWLVWPTPAPGLGLFHIFMSQELSFHLGLKHTTEPPIPCSAEL